MEIFKELNNLGYKQYLPMTVEELNVLSIDSVEFSIEANLAFDWFREKHSLLSFIDIDNSYRIYWNNVKHDLDLDSEIFNTYEEARQSCLEKLIELCKNN